MSPIGGSLQRPGRCCSASRRNAAVSRTVRVTHAVATIRTGICRFILSWASRSRVGLRPTSPLTAAGIRIEPPPSLPCASGTAPAATQAAVPADEAPACAPVSHGERTGPRRGCSADGLKPNSESWVLPIGRPARSRGTSARSRRPSASARPRYASAALLGRHPGDVDVVLQQRRDAREEAAVGSREPRHAPGRRRRTTPRSGRAAAARRGRWRRRRPRGSTPRPPGSRRPDRPRRGHRGRRRRRRAHASRRSR